MQCTKRLIKKNTIIQCNSHPKHIILSFEFHIVYTYSIIEPYEYCNKWKRQKTAPSNISQFFDSCVYSILYDKKGKHNKN